MQVKPADADRFLATPDPAIRVVLIHGSDEGLISERTAAFVKAVTGVADDPFAHVRLESNAIADDPPRLADEAHAIAMFGGRRAISVRVSGNRPIHSAVESILETPPVDSWIVIAAGELRKTAPLRKLCESRKGAAAIACYADAARDLDRIIDEETKSTGLTIDIDARTALKGLIGADRMASRSEIGKLCLYAADAGTIDLAAVRAVIGDASAFAVDETIDAMALGDTGGFDRSFRRLVAAGTPGFVVAGAALRHFGFLHRARAAFDVGTSTDTIVARASPPVFFKRRADVGRQITLWPRPRIENALQRLEKAVIDSRLNGAMSDAVIAQALSMVAAIGSGLRRR